MTVVNYLGYTLGFAYSLLLGHIFVEMILTPFRRRLEIKRKQASSPTLGIIERMLYTGSILYGVEAFIGVWLAIKVASNWKNWEESDTGRSKYNIFLIGNGISILFGATGAIFIKLFLNGLYYEGAILTVVVCIVVLALFYFGEKKTEDNPHPKI